LEAQENTYVGPQLDISEYSATKNAG
jgi:hypothetical protein